MARWPFVGRAAELDSVMAAVGDASVPGVVLAGAAGVGKTRLLQELIAGLDSERCFARRVLATSSTASIPFGAFAPLLPAELPNASSQPNLLRSAADALTADPRPDGALPHGARRLVLGVDDAHVLDEVSAALLHQLAHSGRAFVLASIRTGESAPEPITALWKDELVERLEVGALSRLETEYMLSAVLGGPMETVTVDRLWQTTRGNVLFLRELTNAGVDTGALAQVDDVWRWAGEWVVPPRLTELLAGRLGRLPPEELELLELVAYGSPIAPATLARLVSPNVVQSCEDRDLLRVDGSEVHLSHPLYGEVLRAECPTFRTRRWKLRLAEAFEAAGPPRKEDWLRIATWRLDAGEAVRPDVLTSGMREAWAKFDLGLTERLGKEAIAAGEGVTAVRTVWRAMFLAERTTELEELLGRWMLAPMSGDDHRDLVLGRVLNLFWGLDEEITGLNVLRDAEAITTDQSTREFYSGLDALLLANSGRPAESLELAEPLLAAGPQDAHAEAMARTAQCLALGYLGRLESTKMLRSARALVSPWEDQMPFLDVMVDLVAVQALAYGGQLEEADKLSEAVLRRADERGHGFASYIHLVGRAQVVRLQGRPGSARRLLRDGLSRFRYLRVGWYHVPVFLLSELAHNEALLGNAAAAEAAFAELEQLRRASVRSFDIWSDLARPWVVVAAGDRTRGIELVAEAVAEHRRTGARSIEIPLLHDLVRMGEASRAVDRLTDLCAERRPNRFLTVVMEQASAAAKRDGAGLERAAEGFGRIGAVLFAAEAYAQAGRAYHAAGKRASARAAATRAAVVLDRCEGAVTPATESILAPDLTRRERDVAMLAAQGLSTPQIAERLVVSKRTVDNHLRQVYGKLGVSGRSELTGLLPDAHNTGNASGA